ncbi:MAG TPA: class I SAM-dependent methyltransferase [Nitrospirota bacterium]|nr:class I SAM-dependent methyltransferase [Nitrospirota bacterium]
MIVKKILAAVFSAALAAGTVSGIMNTAVHRVCRACKGAAAGGKGVVMEQAKKDFNKEAAQWDENPGRVRLANDIAEAMIRETAPSPDMDVLDFGCGTGLVTLRLQPFVRSILGADSSEGMLRVLQGKIAEKGIVNVNTQIVDFEKGDRVAGAFHLIVSSMTLHHVPDPAALFRQWRDLLLPAGRICFADLDTEDGSFHSDNTGVFHEGFDRVHLKRLLQDAGFSSIRDTTAAAVKREGGREYPVFLILARK